MTQQIPLLARYAESLFWMARYMERLENLARLVDVTQTFESPGLENEAWDSLIRIYANETHFAETHDGLEPDAVKRYYVLERQNPNSIISSIEAARMNARTLRPLISTEMWKHLNVFHRDLLQIAEHELQGDNLSRLCSRIKEGVQAHTGITEGTLFRDQGWHFYEMGRLIERADQTTRLLDIKFHRMLPKGSEDRRHEERTQWGGVLRAVAGYHAFRRIAPVEFLPQHVAGFLLTDPCFPRSVLLCLSQTEWHLTQLRTSYGLRGTRTALEQIEDMRAALLDRSAEQIISIGLHDFLDGMQRDLIGLAASVGDAFFRDWKPSLQQAQSQSQSTAQP
ncbi:alpha-E domain-containing protein [Acidisoma cellulosilytica]|uniref:Alpha-E domain-containing protein n=1 Tax=Acidisoma cellulosilyticum TaxID=2802395 RepID=A0A963YZV5_9PROT|nr:alpha-E domain-containing protein [Acidisoma cellulosilyticum]MCB8879230.1 alpha-E domain-containing protein [Acidisoma cellulosilyticum]